MPDTRDNFQLGTENGPDGSKKTVRFTLSIGMWQSITLTSNEEIQAFALWVNEAQELMRDIAQQSHAWTTPSSAPTLFENLQEELDELKYAGSLK